MADIPDHYAGIAFAQPEDEDAIYKHLLELHSENGIFSVDEGKVREFIQHATQQRGGLIGIIRGDTGIEGSAGAVMEQWWYTQEFCLGERWVFVHPDYRSKNHATRLVDFLKWCAAQLHLPLLAGILSTSRVEAKERLYQRRMTRVGGFFMDNAHKPVIVGGEEIKADTAVVHLDDLRKASRKVAASV